MSKMLFNIVWEGENPNIEQVAKKYNFKKKDLDKDFGVVSIDPQDNLYSILVEEKAVVGKDEEGIEGPFSNPRIEPFDLKE